MSETVTPVQKGAPTVLILVAVGGFSLFWASFFSMLLRNSFLDVGIADLWHHLALRIAFFIGFGIASYAVSHLRDGIISGKTTTAMIALTAVFSLIAVASSAAYAVTQTAHPLAFDVIAWGLSGAGLCCLFFLWIDPLSRIEGAAQSLCLAISVACGACIYLMIGMLPAYFNIAVLALCPLVSLVILKAVALETHATEQEVISLPESKTNAGLSWAFGAIYAVYGIVFGLGAGSITQIQGGSLLYAGVAGVLALGACAALLFMRRLAGRIRQNDMLRMLFPFLVISLVPMAFLTGYAYALCNLLLLACYMFLFLVSIAYEIQTARARHSSCLFFVGMSQTALSGGLVVGFGLGLASTVTGVVNYSMLSAIALGLVVLLAVFIAYAPIFSLPAPGDLEFEHASDPEPEHDEEHEHEQGHWRLHCTTVAQRYGLSARETEVFFLLAKGRGIEHIQNKLFISGHTVKTHTYNIYKKMGIGSREELLDVVEAEKNASKPADPHA